LATGGKTKVLEFQSWYGKELSIIHVVETDSGSHIISNPKNDGDYFPGVRQLGRESDNSHPNSAEIKITWACTSAPKYVLKA
jgi:hypothetical protein